MQERDDEAQGRVGERKRKPIANWVTLFLDLKYHRIAINPLITRSAAFHDSV